MPHLLYGRDNRKRTKRRWGRLSAAAALLAVLAVGLSSYYFRASVPAALAAARLFVFDNSYFAVREIQVRGGEKIGGNEVVAMAGLREGMNLWNVEPGAIEQKIARLPWVRRVLVRREFPRRVVIEVEEREPKAIVAMGKLYYVDSEGVVFKEVDRGEKVNFPLLTGFKPEDLTNANAALRYRIQDAVRVGELMAKDSHTLSEIHFEAPDRLVVYTTAYPVAMRLGWGDWEGKLQRLDRVLSLWKGHEDRLASLDVSFRDQVVTRLRKGNGK